MTNELGKGDDYMVAFREGDSRVLNTIFDEFYDALCYFAARLIIDSEEAKDIVGESFIKLWELRGNFKSMQNVKAFLYITTRNTCLNYLKQAERSARQQQEAAYIIAENDDLSLMEVTRAELLRQLYMAIESLPPQCQKIIKMSYVLGKKNQEIAEELGLSLQTIKNQKSRAVELLKARLAKKTDWMLLVLYLYLSGKN